MTDHTSPPRRLYRSRRDKVIGGVCGGLGGYFNLDPVVIRVIWLALILFGGTGVLAYIIAWILIPETPDDERDLGRVERKTDGTRLAGVILIVLALVWIGSLIGFYDVRHLPWHWIGPLALVALGVALLLRKGVHEAAEKAEERALAAPPPPPPPAPEPAPEPEAEATADASDAEPDRSGEESTEPEDTPDQGEADSSGASDAGEGDDKKDDRPFERRPLRRSVTDKVIGGVCGGLGKYFHMDSTALRLLFAFITVASGGIGLLAYLVLWIAVGEEEF